MVSLLRLDAVVVEAYLIHAAARIVALAGRRNGASHCVQQVTIEFEAHFLGRAGSRSGQYPEVPEAELSQLHEEGEGRPIVDGKLHAGSEPGIIEAPRCR